MTRGGSQPSPAVRAPRPPSRAYRFSPALRWPVRAPSGVLVFLSTHQRNLYAYALAHPGMHATTAQLADATGNPSAGRVSDNLARLRFLGLLGVAGVRGRHGYVRWWIGEARHGGVGTAAFRRRSVGSRNDSIPPSGKFYSLAHYARTAAAEDRLSGYPPGSPGRGGLAGPRRGRRPPRIAYSRCPSGHPVRSGRWSWTGSPLPLHAEYRGWCRRCRVHVLETVTLKPHGPSPELHELAAIPSDPALAARRADMARRLSSAGSGLERWTSAYLPPPPPLH
jgi:hypothetical protein